MKKALYVLRRAKIHLSDWSNVEQQKIKLVALAIIKLC